MGGSEFETFLGQLVSVRRYRDTQGRAPHKPLVLLHALGALRHGVMASSFSEVEAAVGPVIVSLWNETPSVEQPFVRLLHDGIWWLSVPEADVLTPSHSISAARLRDQGVRGGFPPEVTSMLSADTRRIQWAARVVAYEVGLSAKAVQALDAFGLGPG